MEDRININGVWYVRENNDIDNSLEEYMRKNVVSYQCMAYEDFDWVFQAHANIGPETELDFIQIENKVTGKREMWDSLSFITGFNGSTYLYTTDDILARDGAKLMHYFINEIKKKGWL